jgi:hypothetical protein
VHAGSRLCVFCWGRCRSRLNARSKSLVAVCFSHAARRSLHAGPGTVCGVHGCQYSAGLWACCLAFYGTDAGWLLVRSASGICSRLGFLQLGGVRLDRYALGRGQWRGCCQRGVGVGPPAPPCCPVAPAGMRELGGADTLMPHSNTGRMRELTARWSSMTIGILELAQAGAQW